MRTHPYVVALLLSSSLAQKSHVDFMESLPNAPSFKSYNYSGYLDVNANKQLHYTFAESLDNPTKDPVIIWFNGGPGCSSMMAYMQESGPNVIDDGEAYIKENPWPWNMRANVAYIESPAGVGYSLAATQADLQQDDDQSAADNYAAVLSFFKKFPELMDNEVYIAGESYAGIYVPYLANAIYDGNAKLPEAQRINLAGFMVGNGATDFHVDIWPTYATLLHGLSMIPTSLLDKWNTNNCHKYFHDVFPNNVDTKGTVCNTVWNELLDLTINTGINWYDLYRKTYAGGLSSANPEAEHDPNDHTVTRPLRGEERNAYTFVDGERKDYKVGYTMNEYTPWMKPLLGDAGENSLSNYVAHYLNREDVRTAMHIPSSAPGWTECNDVISDTYKVGTKGSYWIYEKLRNQMKIMFYCGDTDGAVPCWGTRQWIHNLKWEVTQETQNYHTDGQMAGQVTRYDGMDFATVHGAGHMCPQWKRKTVTTLISQWVHGEKFWE